MSGKQSTEEQPTVLLFAIRAPYSMDAAAPEVVVRNSLRAASAAVVRRAVLVMASSAQYPAAMLYGPTGERTTLSFPVYGGKPTPAQPMVRPRAGCSTGFRPCCPFSLSVPRDCAP